MDTAMTKKILICLFIKSLCKQRLLVLQRILKVFSYYYSSFSRQNLVRASPTVLLIQFCHLAHIFNCVPCREAVCTIFMMVFGMTRPGREPTTYLVRGGHANH